MEEKLYLAFVNPIGKNAHDMYEYEFFFTEAPDIVWGEDWNEQCPSACGSLFPAGETYSKIMRLTSIIPFTCAQENSCFSLQDSVDNILALAFENISEYTECSDFSEFSHSWLIRLYLHADKNQEFALTLLNLYFYILPIICLFLCSSFFFQPIVIQ